mgnify:CR=1 FL=1
MGAGAGQWGPRALEQVTGTRGSAGTAGTGAGQRGPWALEQVTGTRGSAASLGRGQGVLSLPPDAGRQ